MDKLRNSGKILTLISGIFVTVISFIFYWVVYGFVQGSETVTSNIFPMIVLLFGVVGGVLLFLSSFYVYITKYFGLILATVAFALTIVATIYSMCNLNAIAGLKNYIMGFLPCFVVSNAIGLAGVATLFAVIFQKK